MGTEGDDLLFEHIATGTELKVASSSMEVRTGTEPGRSISFAGFVKWRGEWWFSGSRLGWGYDDDLIRKGHKGRKLPGQDMLLENKYKNKAADRVQVEAIPGMIYCDADSGIELVFGFNDLIPDVRNKWYMGDDTEEDPVNESMMMLESPHISGKWMHYQVSSY